MSDRRLHNLLASKLLPKVDPAKIDRVNALIDGPSSWAGPGHRKFFHSQRDQMFLAAMSMDPEVFLIGQIHTRLDQDPRLQKLLEFLK